MALSTTATNALTFRELSGLGLTGAEISAYDRDSKRLFVTSSSGLQVVDISEPSSPTLISNLDFRNLGFGTTDITSVSSKNGIIAIALPDGTKSNPGRIVFLRASDLAVLSSITVGALPDMVSFSPDGKTVLVANEGEYLDSNGGPGSTAGSVSIISLENGAANPSVRTADFEAFNGQENTLRAAGVRIFAGQSASLDLEPEYIAISPDGTRAMVTLQEANAVGLLDIKSAKFTQVVALGTKDFSSLFADFSDRDGAGSTTSINLQTGLPVRGLYMPDGIDSYTAGGKTYYAIANEGDDRDDFINPDETVRVGSGSYDLDNGIFPTESTLKNNAALGRLTVSNAPGLRGDTDGDGDIDQILAYGARSFSILNSEGAIVFDSGDIIERIISENFPSLFDDTRSDNKGPEPEGIEIASISGRTYAFVGLERSNINLIFDVTNPTDVSYTGSIRRPGDVSPEGGLFISAGDSPNGRALFVVSNEVSNSVSIFQILAPGSTLTGAVATRPDGSPRKKQPNDQITGTSGDDDLLGYDGADRLIGGDGADFLLGGVGRDRLWGGAGADLFRYDAFGRRRHVDRIMDFSPNEGDRIDLSDMDANTSLSGDQSFKFVGSSQFSGDGNGSIRFKQKKNNTHVLIDSGNGGREELRIILAGSIALGASDFFL
jgi:Ca2+-binding RTX toxin-like protein